jgi:hypothetical protein
MRTTWIVEDAVHAYIPPGECTVNPGTGVVTAVVEIEVGLCLVTSVARGKRVCCFGLTSWIICTDVQLAGQKEPAVSLMSIPAHCLEDGKVG